MSKNAMDRSVKLTPKEREALAIIEAESEPIHTGKLARLLGRSRSRALQIVKSLESAGMIVREAPEFEGYKRPIKVVRRTEAK